MSLPWCKRCENQAEEGYINTTCLQCKWEYVGQETFDKKSDYFRDNGNVECETPEDEGRLMMLPCKVGDFVYKIIYQRDNFDDRSYRIVTEVRFRPDMIDDIGKTIFLTREEAEKALKEREIGNETD